MRNIWNVRSGLLESFESFFAKLNLTGSEAVLTDASLALILNSLLEGSLRDFKYVSIRNQGLQLVKNIIEKLKGKQRKKKRRKKKSLAIWFPGFLELVL